MNGNLRFAVLGPVRAWLGGAELALGSPQQRAILAILLLRDGASITSDELIGAIWGESSPRAAAGMVRSYVSRLRHVLDPGEGHPAAVIESVAGGYALPVSVGTLDLTLFEQRIAAGRHAHRVGDAVAEATALREALALWKGTPLAGVPGEYAESERVRLIQLRLAAIEDLVAVDIELGRHVEVTTELTLVIAEHPLRERPRELLMLALYRSGRQADALAVYQETRRLLAEQLGINPGPGLREMQRRILSADPTLIGAASLRPPVATPLPKPAQLPPDLPDFVGRTEILRGLGETLSQPAGGVPVVGIVGLGGVGKTALATHAGHAVAAAFPDGQFFVDLGGSDETRTEPYGVLAGLLRAVGVPDEVLPESLGERAALWRTITTGRRVLVVLDDAREGEQVRPLLPGSGGSAVMVTARRRHVELAGVRWLKLDELSEDEALTLLERIVGAERIRAEPEAARRFAVATSGLPLALHIVGFRLAARPGWSIATAEERLRNQGPEAAYRQPECSSIELPYQAALRELHPAQARAFRLVAVPDGPDISLAAAAAVLDLPWDETENLLESLADVHLIEPGSPGRYRYHNPVRVFARGRALLDDGVAECRAALGRLVRFYLASVGNALRAIEPGAGEAGVGEPAVADAGTTLLEGKLSAAVGLRFGGAEPARSWLLLEHDHLQAATVQAAGTPGVPADKLARLIGRGSQPVPDRHGSLGPWFVSGAPSVAVSG